jgi:hypothetical protein
MPPSPADWDSEQWADHIDKNMAFIVSLWKCYSKLSEDDVTTMLKLRNKVLDKHLEPEETTIVRNEVIKGLYYGCGKGLTKYIDIVNQFNKVVPADNSSGNTDGKAPSSGLHDDDRGVGAVFWPYGIGPRKKFLRGRQEVAGITVRAS